MISSILDGSIENTKFKSDPIFGLNIPLSLDNVDDKILNPRDSWVDKNQYDETAKYLANLFIENFKLYGEKVSYLVKAGPLL